MASLTDFPEPEVRFDREKFKAVVHYVCTLCNDDPDALGKTKLHKALYYSDMLCFIETGHPLTGVDYIKQPFGPTARHLGWALRVLSEEQALTVKRRPYHGLGKFDFEAHGNVANRLTDQERQTIYAVVQFVCGYSAKEISEISHARPWDVVELGARIPYSAAFLLLPQKLPSKKDVEWATEVAESAIRAGA